MHLHRLAWGCCLLGLLLGCATTPPETSIVWPTVPEQYRGDALRASTSDNGIAVEVLADGDGTPATGDKHVWFHYDVFDVQTGERLKGSLQRPTVAVIGEEPSNPFDAVLQQVLRDQKPGYRARVMAPAEIFNASKPARAPLIGDLCLTLTILHVHQPKPPPPRLGIEAFASEPIAVSTLDDGSQLHEYARGDGIAATDGDIVELYMTTIYEGREFEIDGMEKRLFFWFDDAPSWLLGVRPGALRSITHESMVVYIQVLDVLR